MHIINAAGMDETYVTYVDDECFDIQDYDDDTDHLTMIMMMILTMILVVILIHMLLVMASIFIQVKLSHIKGC